MKDAIQLVLLLALSLITNEGLTQSIIPSTQGVESIYITAYWGDITLKGVDNKEFVLTATFTDTSKNPIYLKEFEGYLKIKREGNKLYVSAREPKGFESIDIKLELPKNMLVNIELLKGGNINGQDLKNGVEVNSLNGSVQMTGLGNYAMISAANGEIKASFDSLNPKLPISLVTMNGGVSVVLPTDAKRDVRLISRKNGYVSSNLLLESKRPIANLNIEQYSKDPITADAIINGGGALLFLSTENGPISIMK